VGYAEASKGRTTKKPRRALNRDEHAIITIRIFYITVVSGWNRPATPYAFKKECMMSQGEREKEVCGIGSRSVSTVPLICLDLPLFAGL
jgi:hypothetical protein